MSTADAQELKQKMAELRDVMEKGELEEMQEKTKELQEKSWAVTQSMYGQSEGKEEDKKDSSK